MCTSTTSTPSYWISDIEFNALEILKRDFPAGFDSLPSYMKTAFTEKLLEVIPNYMKTVRSC